MTRSAPWLVAALCALVGGTVWYSRSRRVDAGPIPAETVVRNAWSLGRKVPVEGRQLVQVRDQLRVEARVLQSEDGDIKIEYVSGKLKGFTLWENEAQTYRYNPTRKRLTVSRKRQTEEDRQRQELQLLQNYTARKAGEGEIAGKRAVIVELRARADATRWRRVWIDPKTWFILASEEYRGPGREPQRSSRFTELVYLDAAHSPRDEQFVPPAELIKKYAVARPGDTASRFTPDQLSELIGFPIRQPAHLPAGYRLDGAYPTPCACSSRHQAARLEYSDGLATLTLFQCAHPRCPAGTLCFGSDPRAVMTAHRRVGRYYYLVVGDSTHEEQEQVLDSLLP